MAGNKSGSESAKRQVETIKRKYGDNYFREIGAEGGRNGFRGGFYANRELARIAGKKGGTISRRGPKLPDPKPSFISKVRRFLDADIHN